VLVCARGGGGLLRERMALVSSLWAAGLAAELLPAAAPSATAQYEYARAAGIAWMVTLQAATLSSSDTVVVSGTKGHAEIYVTGAAQRTAFDVHAACSQVRVCVSPATDTDLDPKLHRGCRPCIRGLDQVKNLERKGAEEEAVPYADVARFLQVRNLHWCRGHKCCC
jgi:hypothetical protein